MHKEGYDRRSIAKKLKLSKQAVSAYLREALSKLNNFFIELSEIMDLDIKKFETAEGVLVGVNRQTGDLVYIIYIPKIGFRTIFYSNIREYNCPNYSSCYEAIRYLLAKDEDKMKEIQGNGVKEAITKLEKLLFSNLKI
ncbi:MAG: hypothetical protein ACP6IP_01145 [Candidatus Njordarchaeia archaeon]